MKISHILLGAAALLAASAPSMALDIYTGGEKGAYYGTFCPPLKAFLDKKYFTASCALSDGTGANFKNLETHPENLAFLQPDVTYDDIQKAGMVIVRDDLFDEGLFLVTKNPDLKSLADIAKLAGRIPFILPPELSGSTKTFQRLMTTDPSGLGKANKFTYKANASEAIDATLADGRAVTFFVQAPDPTNPIFKKITDSGAYFIPVVSRQIMDYKMGDKPLFKSLPTVLKNPNGMKIPGAGDGFVTTGMSVLVVTGNPDKVDADKKRDQAEMIDLLRTAALSEVLPIKKEEPAQQGKPAAASSDYWTPAKQKALSVSNDALDWLMSLGSSAKQTIEGLSK